MSRPGTVTLHGGKARFALTLVTEERDPILVRASELRGAGDLPRAAEVLTEGLVSAQGAKRHALQFALAMLHTPGTSFGAVEQAAAADRDWWWAAAAASIEAHRAAVERSDTAAAFATVGRIESYREQAGGRLGYDVDYNIDWYRSWALRMAGDHRRAQAGFERVALEADRVGADADAADARRYRATSLARAGALDEALAILQAEVAGISAEQDPCRTSVVLVGYAWALILAREAGHSDVPTSLEAVDDPRPLLDRALALLDQGCAANSKIPVRETREQAHLNAALVAMWDGDLERTRTHLTASAGSTDPWSHELRGRLALARREPKAALDAFRALEAQAGEQLEFRWMGARGQGAALELLGDHEEAIAAYEQAQSLFFRQGLLVPVHLGRQAFYAQREQATARLARLLLADERPAEAFDAYRDQRAQYLYGLHTSSRLESETTEVPLGWFAALTAFRDARDELAALPDPEQAAADTQSARRAAQAEIERRSLEALDAGNVALGVQVSIARRRPAEGEVLVGWFPGVDEWVGFAESAGQVQVARWPGAAPPPDASLFAPFADVLSTASLVTLLPVNSLTERDLLRAPVRGVPLALRAPVRISLDLTDRVPVTSPVPQGALLVGDPVDDRPGSAASTRRHARAFAARGWTVNALVGSENVRRAAIVDALDGSGLFWYDGHGLAQTRWKSSIALGDGGLEVADVLALPTVPPWVVLNACETAGQTDEGSLGVAQAFVVAGARAVIATTRPVDDALAEAFATRLNAALDRRTGHEDALILAYHEAIRAVAEADPRSDWGAYRLLVP